MNGLFYLILPNSPIRRVLNKPLIINHFVVTNRKYFSIATVSKLIEEKLPPLGRMSTNSKDLIIQLCMTFLNTLAAKSNIVCGQKNKKTVCPDHVIDAMVVSQISLTAHNQI